jgi:hypothetical protein
MTMHRPYRSFNYADVHKEAAPVKGRLLYVIDSAGIGAKARKQTNRACF